MICIPDLDSKISAAAKFGVVNSQFLRFLRLCSSKKFIIAQMVSFSLLKRKHYCSKFLWDWFRGLLNKERFLFGVSAFVNFKLIIWASWSWIGSFSWIDFALKVLHVSLFSSSFLVSFFLCSSFFLVSLIIFCSFMFCWAS